MRIITGCLKSTPTQWLPTMSSIAPPHIRREEANQKLINQLEETPDDIPLKQMVNSAPSTSRLKSRRPFYRSKLDGFNVTDAWTAEWTQDIPRGGHVIKDPTVTLPGFKDSKRKYWVTANRLRTGHGRTASNMHRWQLRESPACPRCGGESETTDHIILDCHTTKLEGGYETVHNCDDILKAWIDKFNVEV